MATFISPEEDQENRAGQAPEPEGTNALTSTTAAPAASGGQQSAAAGAPSAGGAPQRKPSSSGQFVDIGKYYEAGKDKAQGAQQQVASSLQQRAQQAQQKLGQEASQYTQGLQQYRASADPFQGRAATGVNRGQFEDLFRQKNLGTFTSGQGLADLRKATADIQSTDTAAGRTQALRSLADKGYSAGESRLDQALLNRAERGDQVLGRLRGQYGDDFAGQQAAAAQQQAAQARSDIQAQRAGVQAQARDWLRGQREDYNRAAQRLQQQADQRAQQDYRDLIKKMYEDRVATERQRIQDDYSSQNKREADAFQAAIINNPVAAASYAGARTADVVAPSLEEVYQRLDPSKIVGAADLSSLADRRGALENLAGIAGGEFGQLYQGRQGTTDQTAAIQNALNEMIRRGEERRIGATEYKPVNPGVTFTPGGGVQISEDRLKQLKASPQWQAGQEKRKQEAISKLFRQ